MANVSKHHGINDNMSLVAGLILVPFMIFLALQLYKMLKAESDEEAAKQAKKQAKKDSRGRKGSKKE